MLSQPRSWWANTTFEIVTFLVWVRELGEGGRSLGWEGAECGHRREVKGAMC